MFNLPRVRIAPSPTGYLHIGTARTALFNWLFAKKQGGKFILRIEDTDLERSEKKYEKDIIDGLSWLGLEWDEGPYRQSERLNIYEKYLKQLLKEEKAYYCDCGKEELEKERQEQQKRGESPKYSGKCRDRGISAEQAQVIRFKIGEEEIKFKDLIRGEISFKSGLIGDIAIAKNLRTPLYNFAVVVDDYEMEISQVIRGEDHIANTPKQILIQKALNFPHPQYAHLPLILDPDRSKMSKRYSATSIKEYQTQGYLPEALVNFITLLGWHPNDDREKMSIPEIIEKFDLGRIQKGGAIFDIQKLDWLNAQYIKEKSNEELARLINELYGEEIKDTQEKMLKILKVGKERMVKLSDYLALKESFELSEYPAELLIWKNSDKFQIKENLRKTQEIIRGVISHEFNRETLEKLIMPLADSEGRGEVLWPLRVALSGKDKSPGPFEIIEVIDKEETLERLKIALEKME
jgi:nondiscriminating glutamyl-tRNA synthetase